MEGHQKLHHIKYGKMNNMARFQTGHLVREMIPKPLHDGGAACVQPHQVRSGSRFWLQSLAAQLLARASNLCDVLGFTFVFGEVRFIFNMSDVIVSQLRSDGSLETKEVVAETRGVQKGSSADDQVQSHHQQQGPYRESEGALELVVTGQPHCESQQAQMDVEIKKVLKQMQEMLTWENYIQDNKLEIINNISNTYNHVANLGAISHRSKHWITEFARTIGNALKCRAPADWQYHMKKQMI